MRHLFIPLRSALAALSVRAADKPNVVLFYADDLGYGDVSSHGSKKSLNGFHGYGRPTVLEAEVHADVGVGVTAETLQNRPPDGGSAEVVGGTDSLHEVFQVGI